MYYRDKPRVQMFYFLNQKRLQFNITDRNIFILDKCNITLRWKSL